MIVAMSSFFTQPGAACRSTSLRDLMDMCTTLTSSQGYRSTADRAAAARIAGGKRQHDLRRGEQYLYADDGWRPGGYSDVDGPHGSAAELQHRAPGLSWNQ